MLNCLTRRGLLAASLVALAVGGLAVPAAAGSSQAAGTTVHTSGPGCSATGSGLHGASAPATNPTAAVSSQFQQQVTAAPASAWQRLPGAARDIGVGADGSAWVIGRTPTAGGYSIHRWTGSGWTRVSGGAIGISVDPAGQPWIFNDAGVIYRRTATGWQRLPDEAQDIGVGANGSAWMICFTPEAGGYGIFRWTGSDWVQVSGGAVRIDVDPAGQPWIVNNAGAIYRRSGTGWQRLPGAARDIGVGADGSAWVIGRTPTAGGYSIHRWTGSAWSRVSGGAVRIDVGPTGQPWIVNDAGAIYRQS